MLNKLSFKIGFVFFAVIIIIESILFYVLYHNLANDRIDEAMESLLARGNTHRDVLESHFDQSTLEHVGIMESASEFSVVITDGDDEVIIASDPINDEMMEIMLQPSNDSIPPAGKIVDSRLSEGNYIATDSPITIGGKHEGHVFMFVSTDYVKRVVDPLAKQFILMSIITVCLTIITIFILSRVITQPLIKMKEATEKLSKGNHNVALHTDRKDELGELANSITRLSKDLEALKLARNEFLSSISHELRTPLTYIKGYADMIHRPQTSPEERQKYLDIIREETEQLNGLIADLFQLAKLDHHNFPIRQEDVDLYPFLQQLTARMRPSLLAKDMTITIACPRDLVLYVDPERFQQVVTNILENAKSYAYEGTSIDITVKETAEETICTITDRGVGIPAADLPYIFDRLYRVEKSRSRISGGAGLGLAICKEIIDSHQGELTIESEEGIGTRVKIVLPRRKEDA